MAKAEQALDQKCFAGILVDYDVPCEMRDKTVLKADIYWPNKDENSPVLLMRQPYGKQIASTVTYAHPIFYAQRGYVVVIQDVRGRGHSQGMFDPFVHEAEDGYDTVQWASKLSGSTRGVGMYGFSYQGSTQWAALSLRPPSLKAIAPFMCAADLYHGWFYPQGVLALKNTLMWAIQLTRDSIARQGANDGELELLSQWMREPEQVLWHVPYGKQDILDKWGMTFFQEWVSHPHYDSYWERLNWLDAIRNSGVPTLQLGGWYDPFLEGTTQSFEVLQPENKDIALHQIIIGPWGHIPWGVQQGSKRHPNARLAIDRVLIQWFDQWLKGAHARSNQSVRYYEVGSELWRESAEWPPQSIDMPYRLTNPGFSNGGGQMIDKAGEARDNLSCFVYDARLPMRLDGYEPQDRSHVQERNEILVYTSLPFTQPTTIAGSCHLNVTVEVADGPTDLIAILTVVDPETGYAVFLAVGRSEIGLNPGPDLASLTFRPVAYCIEAGRAIRLELTGSAFPLYRRHPNGVTENEIPWAGDSMLKIATVAVFHSADKPATLVLPIRADSKK